MKVVRMINNTQIKSKPNLKLIKPFIQFFSSINWKLDVVVSKEYQRKSERKKLDIEDKIATYLEFFTMLFSLPWVIKINKAPINGINTIAERIGKFI